MGNHRDAQTNGGQCGVHGKLSVIAAVVSSVVDKS